MDIKPKIILPPDNRLAEALGEPLHCVYCGYQLSGKPGKDKTFCSQGCMNNYYFRVLEKGTFGVKKNDKVS